jgi:ATP-dependent RNA helicase DOB1
MADKKMEHD